MMNIFKKLYRKHIKKKEILDAMQLHNLRGTYDETGDRFRDSVNKFPGGYNIRTRKGFDNFVWLANSFGIKEVNNLEFSKDASIWFSKNVEDKKKLIKFLTPKGYKKGAQGGAINNMLGDRGINAEDFQEAMTKYGDIIFDTTFYYMLEMAKDKKYLDNTTTAQALIDGHHTFQVFLSDFYKEVDDNRKRAKE